MAGATFVCKKLSIVEVCKVRDFVFFLKKELQQVQRQNKTENTVQSPGCEQSNSNAKGY